MSNDLTQDSQKEDVTIPSDTKVFPNINISEVSLIAANLVPIFGILFANWNPFDIVIVYWIESAVIGFWAIFRILFSSNNLELLKNSTTNTGLSLLATILKLAIISFFIFHYGLFVLALGILIFTLFKSGSSSSVVGLYLHEFKLFTSGLWCTSIALFVSHGISFFSNYIGKGEYKKTFAAMEMVLPYKRIAIMQVTIIVGMGIGILFGTSKTIAIILVIAKIVADYYSHLSEHSKRLKNKNY